MHLKNKRRKINGKFYTAHISRKKKADAEVIAKNLRKKGWLATIMKSDTEKHGKEYYIYRRRK